MKYFSHLEQGLGVLDLNSKEDYEIYTALKDQRKTVNYPIVLTTHGGLFSIILLSNIATKLNKKSEF